MSATAQLPHARLDSIFPPGGQRGTNVDVTVSGADLDEGRELVFSHPKLVAWPKRTPADEFYPEGQPVANQFTVEIGADVPPGFYEAQLSGRHGLSTIRVFHVTDFADIADNGNNHTVDQPQALTVGQVVNGLADAEQVDTYAIDLAQGDEVTCEVWSRRIDSLAEMQVEICHANGAPIKCDSRWEHRDPQVSFAAPETGRYLLRVQDVTFRGGGSFFYRMAVHRQAVVYSVMPPVALPNAEGEFTLFGKRLGAPPGSGAGPSPGEQRTVRILAPESETISGSSAPTTADPREMEVERFAYRFTDGPVAATDVWIGFASSPLVIRQSPGDTQPPAQRLSVPGEFVGRFLPSRNTEWIELQSDTTGEAVIEVYSQRLGEPSDPYLNISQVVNDEQGHESLKPIAEADRGEEHPTMPGYVITSEDPYVRVNLEKDSVYRVAMRDQNSFSRSGQSCAFRLVVRRLQPGFRLLAAPTSPWAVDPKVPLRWPLTLRAGDALAIPIVAVRQDGYAGDIVVTADGLPPSVHCDPITIRAGQTVGQLVLVTDDQVSAWQSAIRIVGEGQAGEARVRKIATPASLAWDTTTANFDRARLNQQLVIAVIPEPAPVSARFDEAEWETMPGGMVTARFAVSARAEVKEAITLAAVGLPDGVTHKFTLAEGPTNNGIRTWTARIELTAGEKVAPGVYDFIVTGKPLVAYRNNPEAASRAGDDQARIAKLLEGFQATRQQLIAAAGATADASTPEIKQLDETIARGEAATKEAAERVTKLVAAAQPADRRTYVVSNVATLHIKEKPKE